MEAIQERTDTRTQWTLDPDHTRVEFTVRSLGIQTVRGRFGIQNGTILWDEDQPESASIEVSLRAASIDTGMARRDRLLRGSDVLDADEYPLITFRSTGVERVDERHLRIQGELTVRAVSQPVSLNAEILDQARRAGEARVTGSVNRRDFGIRPRLLDLVSGNRMNLDIHVRIFIRP